MKVGILAGGFGTRLAEETEVRPKPMVEIGGMPILWHIMMHYHAYGHHEFAIALGYKGEYIKRWFRDYNGLDGSMTVRTATGEVKRHTSTVPDWTVDLVDTGMKTATGGRIKRLMEWMGGGTFMLTWGDGVSDVNLDELLAFHRSHGKLATMTAVRPPARYGQSNSTETALSNSTRNRRRRRAGSMARSSCWSPALLTTSAGTMSCSNKRRCSAWRLTVNSWRFATVHSGSAWIRFERR